jgi:hypothetical protein
MSEWLVLCSRWVAWLVVGLGGWMMNTDGSFQSVAKLNEQFWCDNSGPETTGHWPVKCKR